LHFIARKLHSARGLGLHWHLQVIRPFLAMMAGSFCREPTISFVECINQR